MKTTRETSIASLLRMNLKNAIQHRGELKSRGYWSPAEMEEVNEIIRQLEKRIDAIQQ